MSSSKSIRATTVRPKSKRCSAIRRKAKQKLGWAPKITLPELVKEMMAADYSAARRDSLVKSAGFQAYDYHE